MPDEMGVSVPHLGAPVGPTTAQAVILDDIIPPRYPNGAVVVLQRPGELGVVVTVQLEPGSMLMVIPPEAAAHVRAVKREMEERQRKAIANGQIRRGG